MTLNVRVCSALLVLFASVAVALSAADAAVLELSPGTTEALIAPGAAPATRFAASELTNFLSRVFGAPVPVVTSPTAGRRQIVVGSNEWSKAEGIDPEATGKDDGFVIKATAKEAEPDNDVWIGTKEACSILDISKRTLQNYRSKGTIDFKHCGNILSM